jgi:glycosyltransferase involved in cell wall biosynthesis
MRLQSRNRNHQRSRNLAIQDQSAQSAQSAQFARSVDTCATTATASLRERPRVAIVVSHPIQHFCPMYRRIVADGRVELLVIFAEAGPAARFDTDFNRVVKWQDNIIDGFPSTVISAPESGRAEAVVKELRRFAPDVVYLHGYHQPYLKQAMNWAKGAHVPVMMTTDSELRKPRPLHVRLAKRFVLPWTFRNVDLFLTVGDANEEYFEHYGVDRDRFLRVPFSIDSAAYDLVLAHRDEVRRALRQRLGIPADEVVVLNVGKLILDKGQGYMIRAFAETLKQVSRPVTLLIAGDGSERASLEAQIKLFGPSVRLLGFIGVEELPDYYVAADIYAHPSGYDPHPLAVSEAIYCSLPLVASDRIGSTGPSDDLQIGRNGWVFPYGDEVALANILTGLVNDPALRQRAAEISGTLGPIHASDRIAGLFIQGALGLLAKKNKS